MDTHLVMLITNDTGLQQVVELVLGDWNVRVVTTNDVQQAIRQCNYIKMHLILLDLEMPHGIEAVQQVKANPVASTVPIVVLSLFPSEKGRQARLAGADDVLDRVFDVDTLVEKVRKYLHSSLKSDGWRSLEA